MYYKIVLFFKTSVYKIYSYIFFSISGDSSISIIVPSTSKLPAISFEKILDIFKKHADSPWGWLETDEKFYFYKCDLPPTDAEFSNCVPLMPITTECLIINKIKRQSIYVFATISLANHYLPQYLQQGFHPKRSLKEIL